MNENQKLREALQHAIEDLSSATGFLTKRSRKRQSKTVKALAKLQADIIALPTADHIPDAGEMVNGLTKAETDASASVSGLTAAPGCERERFEAWWRSVQLMTFPKDYDIERLQDWGSAYKPKSLEAWQARAALSAGDAVDAKRYRWLRNKAYNFGYDGNKPSPWCVEGTCHENSRPICGERLDAAIDAALTAQEQATADHGGEA